MLQTKFQSNNFWGAQIHFWLQLSEKNLFFLPRFYRKLVKKWEKKIRKIQQVLWEGDSNKKWECFGKWRKVARELIVVARFCVSYRKYVFHRPQQNFLNFVMQKWEILSHALPHVDDFSLFPPFLLNFFCLNFDGFRKNLNLPTTTKRIEFFFIAEKIVFVFVFR